MHHEYTQACFDTNGIISVTRIGVIRRERVQQLPSSKYQYLINSLLLLIYFIIYRLLIKKNLSIQDLRRKYTGAIPLPAQEKFAEAMVKLQQDKAVIEADLWKVTNQIYQS